MLRTLAFFILHHYTDFTLCRLEIRQVEKTKVDERVRNILYIIEGNEATDDKLLFEVMQEIVDTTMKYCGGVGEIFGGTVHEG